MEKKNLVRLIALALVFVIGAVGGSIYWNSQNKNIYRSAQAEEMLAVLGAKTAEATGEESVWAAKDASGNVTGYIAKETVQGFGGPIEILAACDNDAVIKGVAIGGPDFKETAGLGLRAREAGYMAQFAGKAYPVALTSVSTTGANTYTNTEKGFGGNVTVKVTLDADGKIVAAEATGASESSPAIGTDLSPLAEQLVAAGASAIDGVAGATVTTNAVIKAVDTVLDYVANGGIEAISGATVTSNATVRGVNSAVEKMNAVANFLPEPEVPAIETVAPGRFAAEEQGFGGPVRVELQLNKNGEICEMTVGGENFNETPGLGGRATEPEFAAQFIGKSGSVALGENVDALSGATITSNAVVAAVNKIFENADLSDAPDTAAVVAEASKEPVAEETAPAAAGDAVEGTAKGFGGDVTVKMTVENGAITSFEIAAASETPGLGGRATEPEFAAQFVGKILPVSESDVDLLSGATITSKAVLAALEDAAAKVSAAAEVVEEAAPAGETVEGSAQGFGGTVTVKMGVDNGTITSFEIAAASETPGLGGRATEPEFAAQFIGKTLPVSEADVDLLSGATITSKAVLAAVEDAAAKVTSAAEAVEEAVAEEAAPAAEEAAPAGETVEGSAQGFGGTVTVKMGVENGAITSFEITAASETPGLGGRATEPEFAAQFVGKTLPVSEADVDLLSGATITSKAVLAAVEDAAAKVTSAAEAVEEAAPAAEAEAVEGTAKGFGGDVTVKLTLENGVITSCEITAANETPGLGGRANEPEFAAQFIGKTLPLSLGDIDALTSATITSTAVVNAINEAK